MSQETLSDLNGLAAILQTGSSAALLICVYFIREASQRLSRIEKSLDLALQRKNGDDNDTSQ